MLRRIFAVLVILAFVGCTPSYAEPVTLNTSACKVVYKASQAAIKDFRAGKTQFDVMGKLNNQPTSYWDGSTGAKVYTQVIVIDLMKNVHKGFKDEQILKTVNEACLDNISKAL
jgi:hypothetical protein